MLIIHKRNCAKTNIYITTLKSLDQRLDYPLFLLYKKTHALIFLDRYMFLGNCPPTPPLSQNFALSEK